MKKGDRKSKKKGRMPIVIIIFILAFAILSTLGASALVWIKYNHVFEEITDLKMVQKGEAITVSWDDMDVESYDVMLQQGPDMSSYVSLEDSGFIISDPVPEMEYVVYVTGLFEDGKMTETKKLTYKAR